jgi:uncharacterized membrane protein
MTRSIRTLFASGLLLGLMAGPAQAGLHVCNKTAHRAFVALGYFDGTEWGSKGWWTLPSGDCAELVQDTLTSRYYYLYAVHDGLSGGWNGNRSFCVGQGQFRAKTRKDCLGQGFDRKRFFQVDTGDSADWTETLSD